MQFVGGITRHPATSKVWSACSLPPLRVAWSTTSAPALGSNAVQVQWHRHGGGLAFDRFSSLSTQGQSSGRVHSSFGAPVAGALLVVSRRVHVTQARLHRRLTLRFVVLPSLVCVRGPCLLARLWTNSLCTGIYTLCSGFFGSRVGLGTHVSDVWQYTITSLHRAGACSRRCIVVLFRCRDCVTWLPEQRLTAPDCQEQLRLQTDRRSTRFPKLFLAQWITSPV